MMRRLLNVLTVMSLLLCVAAAALWAWSYDTWMVGVSRGRVVVLVVGGPPPDGEEYVRNYLRLERTAADAWDGLRAAVTSSHGAAGFEYHRGATLNPGSSFPFTVAMVPLWPLVPLTLALPAARLWLSRRRRKRALKGECPRCGYDLKGNVSGACPECGTPRAAA